MVQWKVQDDLGSFDLHFLSKERMGEWELQINRLLKERDDLKKSLRLLRLRDKSTTSPQFGGLEIPDITWREGKATYFYF